MDGAAAAAKRVIVAMNRSAHAAIAADARTTNVSAHATRAAVPVPGADACTAGAAVAKDAHV